MLRGRARRAFRQADDECLAQLGEPLVRRAGEQFGDARHSAGSLAGGHDVPGFLRGFVEEREGGEGRHPPLEHSEAGVPERLRRLGTAALAPVERRLREAAVVAEQRPLPVP
jgi:hypothetical protein